MMAEEPARRCRPTTSGKLRAPAPGPNAAKPPPAELVLWGPHDELRINPQHPAAWPARLLWALVLPVIVVRNGLQIVHAWWRSRAERAELRRRGLL